MHIYHNVIYVYVCIDVYMLGRDRLPTPGFLGFPGGSDINNPPAMWETWV